MRAVWSARLTLRRALDLVAQTDRIVRHEGRGCYVRGDLLPAGAISAGHADFLRDLARASPADLMELRLIVEPAAAALTAVRATSEDLDNIEEACTRISEAKTFAAREQTDADFHLAIFEATRNPVLAALCRSINEARDGDAWVRKKLEILTPERCEFYDRQHAAILSALRGRDVEAATIAVRQHLGTLRADLWGPSLI